MNLKEIVVEETKRLVADKGFRVGMLSQYCMFWRKKHENCVGCECEAGCIRVNAITALILAMHGKQFTPEMFKSIQNKINKILNIDTTREQLKEII